VIWLKTPCGVVFYIKAAEREWEMPIEIPAELLTTVVVAHAVVLAILIALFVVIGLRTDNRLRRIEKTALDSRLFSSSNSGGGNISEEQFARLCSAINELHPLVPSPGFDMMRDQLIALAENYWRLQNIANEDGLITDKNKARSMNSALDRIQFFLKENNIEIVDYWGKKYNPGMNANVSFVEEETQEPYIKRILSPEIRHYGMVAKKAHIVVARNSKEGDK
jgi:hypothetical protein